jgi:hypothetical protein
MGIEGSTDVRWLVMSFSEKCNMRNWSVVMQDVEMRSCLGCDVCSNLISWAAMTYKLSFKIVGPQTNFSSAAAVSRCRQAASHRLRQFRLMTYVSRVGEMWQLRSSSSAPGHDLFVLLCASSTSEVDITLWLPHATPRSCSLCRIIYIMM